MLKLKHLNEQRFSQNFLLNQKNCQMQFDILLQLTQMFTRRTHFKDYCQTDNPTCN